MAHPQPGLSDADVPQAGVPDAGVSGASRPPSRPVLLHFAQGLLMGTADIIPGVSGGTMALIVGIYEDLIASISHVFAAAIALVRFNTAAFKEHFTAVAWRLLLPLGAGIGTAIVVGARLIPPLLEAYPIHARGLFFGLITASLVVPWLRLRSHTPRIYLIALVAAVAAFFATSLTKLNVADPNALQIFASAAVAICAMILPGVSGSFLLLVLGMYEPTLQAVDARDFGYILIFMAGAATGIGLFANLLRWLLEHYHDTTMAALIGLMAGSLRALWPWQLESETGSSVLLAPATPILTVVALALLGFVVVAALVAWEYRRTRTS